MTQRDRTVAESPRTPVHVWRAKDQPATLYHDVIETPNGEHKLTFRNNPRRLIWCFSCGKARWAKNMIAHVYYDATFFFCRTCPEKRRRRRG